MLERNRLSKSTLTREEKSTEWVKLTYALIEKKVKGILENIFTKRWLGFPITIYLDF